MYQINWGKSLNGESNKQDSNNQRCKDIGMHEKKVIGLAILALGGLCIITFFNQLGTLGLMDKTEGLFAEIPRQMLLTGDWVTPRWNTKTFFDYPVWGYWMVGLSYRIFGVTAWAARLPAALAASATVLAVFGTVLRLSPNGEGIKKRVSRALLAGTILTLSPGWIGWGRASVTDMFLSSSIALALLGFLLVWKAGHSIMQLRIGHTLIALFSGIAVLAKGPVGVLLPGLTIILFLLLKRRLVNQVITTPWLPMVALFFGIVLPWYAMATRANGLDFLTRFIGFSNFERFTSVLYSHPGPPWFYFPWVFLLLFPWSIYLPVAMARLEFWKFETWKVEDDPADTALFATIWLVVILSFFSAAATKLAGYILPVVPAGSLLIALLFQPLGKPKPFAKGLRVSIWVNSGLFALAAITVASTKLIIKSSTDYPGLTKSILDSGLPVLLFIVISASSAILGWIAINRSRFQWAWVPNAAPLLVLLATAIPVLLPIIDHERLLPIRELSALAGKSAQPGDSIAVIGFKRYSAILYSNKPVIFANNPGDLVNKISSKNQEGDVFLLGTERELSKFGLNLKECKSSECSIIGSKDAHFLLRSSIKNLLSIRA